MNQELEVQSVKETDNRTCFVCECRGFDRCHCYHVDSSVICRRPPNLGDISEATICAELYHECKRFGLIVRLEVCTPQGRVDAMVWDAMRKPIAIVEVKRAKGIFSRKQLARYQQFGLPVLKLWRLEDAFGLASSLKQLSAGVPIESSPHYVPIRS